MYCFAAFEVYLRRMCTKKVNSIKKRESVKIPLSYYFSIFDKIDDGFKPKDLKKMLTLLENAGVDIFHPLAIHAMNKCFENKKLFFVFSIYNKSMQKPIPDFRNGYV